MNSFLILQNALLNDKYKIVKSSNNKSPSKNNFINFSFDLNNYFIDNFNNTIKCLKNGKHFECLRKEDIESFPDYNTLNKLINISYIYINKKKVIIDFKKLEDISKSFLIISSPKENSNDKIIFTLSVNNKDNDKKNI